jgi:hypothetical protein
MQITVTGCFKCPFAAPVPQDYLVFCNISEDSEDSDAL